MPQRPLFIGSLLVVATTLAACASPKAPATSPPAMTHQCNADAASGYVGKVASAENVEAARQAAGADVARTLSPGQVVTMEYRDGRLNLHVDAARTITRITCG